MSTFIQLGRIKINRIQQKPKLVRPIYDSAHYISAITTLARSLGSDLWMLAGGLAIPIVLGRFYREHTDIDMVTPIDKLPSLIEKSQSKGYHLYTSYTISHNSSGLVLSIRINPCGSIIKLRKRRLSLKNPKLRNELLKNIDLYPFRDRGSFLETCDGKINLKELKMHHVSLNGFGSQNHIYCLNLANIDQLKAQRTGIKHRLDRIVIQNGVHAGQKWFEHENQKTCSGRVLNQMTDNSTK